MNKYKVSSIILSGLLIRQIHVTLRQAAILRTGRERFEKLQEGTMYILNVIEKSDIDMSEFDALALQAIMQEDN